MRLHNFGYILNRFLKYFGHEYATESNIPIWYVPQDTHIYIYIDR